MGAGYDGLMQSSLPVSKLEQCMADIYGQVVFNSTTLFALTLTMNKTGPIIVIEDDIDDKEMLVEIFEKLDYKNEVFYFSDGNHALDFLNQTDVHPFLILSDVNMPKINGFELRNKVFTNEQLQTKCIPYLFFTTAATKKSVMEAYALSVQGFFKKPSTMDDLENTIRKIVEYCQECIAPSQFD